MNLFLIIGVGWVVGMGGYIGINKLKKYNNVNFIDVTPRIIKYKKANERTSINKK